MKLALDAKSEAIVNQLAGCVTMTDTTHNLSCSDLSVKITLLEYHSHRLKTAVALRLWYILYVILYNPSDKFFSLWD